MRVEQLMARTVQTCGPDDTLDQAARLMWDGDFGCLPVCQNNGATQPVGMITDRDIVMCALFQGKPLRELHVAEAMARNVLSCRPEASLADAEKIMRESRIRRLPVIGEQGELVGMITLADLAREAAREHAAGRAEISEQEVGDTLSAICEPNRPQAIA